MNPLNLVQESIEKTAKRQEGKYIKVDLAIDFETAKGEMTKIDQRLNSADRDLLVAQAKMEDAKGLLMKIETDGIALKSQIDVARKNLDSEAAKNSNLPKIAAAFKEESARMDTIWNQTTDIIIMSKKLRGAKV